jgi:hypothetical protein
MAIPYINSGPKGNKNNSKGSEVASSVNQLIDAVETNVTISEEEPDNGDGKPDGAVWYRIVE